MASKTSRKPLSPRARSKTSRTWPLSLAKQANYLEEATLQVDPEPLGDIILSEIGQKLLRKPPANRSPRASARKLPANGLSRAAQGSDDIAPRAILPRS